MYTGDLRLHGADGTLTMRFAEEASKLRPKILFCEGTRVTRFGEEVITETEVHDRARTVIKGTKGVVIADFGSRNIERLCTFREIAAECGRQLVLMTRDIHLLQACFLAGAVKIDPSKKQA